MLQPVPLLLIRKKNEIPIRKCGSSTIFGWIQNPCPHCIDNGLNKVYNNPSDLQAGLLIFVHASCFLTIFKKAMLSLMKPLSLMADN
jgi:hypothetical protein